MISMVGSEEAVDLDFFLFFFFLTFGGHLQTKAQKAQWADTFSQMVDWSKGGDENEMVRVDNWMHQFVIVRSMCAVMIY